MSGQFYPGLLSEPSTLLPRFTPTGYIRGDRRCTRLQIAEVNGSVCVWTVGPMGWWHDFKGIPHGASFDDVVKHTHIPSFYGWDLTVEIGRRIR